MKAFFDKDFCLNIIAEDNSESMALKYFVEKGYQIQYCTPNFNSDVSEILKHATSGVEISDTEDSGIELKDHIHYRV